METAAFMLNKRIQYGIKSIWIMMQHFEKLPLFYLRIKSPVSESPEWVMIYWRSLSVSIFKPAEPDQKSGSNFLHTTGLMCGETDSINLNHDAFFEVLIVLNEMLPLLYLMNEDEVLCADRVFLIETSVRYWILWLIQVRS